MTTIKINQPGFALFISTEEIEKAKNSCYTKPYPVDQMILDLSAAIEMLERKHR